MKEKIPTAGEEDWQAENLAQRLGCDGLKICACLPAFGDEKVPSRLTGKYQTKARERLLRGEEREKLRAGGEVYATTKAAVIDAEKKGYQVGLAPTSFDRSWLARPPKRV